MLFYHWMYPWKRVSLCFSYFLSLLEETGALAIPSIQTGTEKRWDPTLVLADVALCRRHIAQYPGVCVQLVPSISHIPSHAGQMWSSFAQKCLYIPLSLILCSAGLKMCLNHKGSLIILSNQEMLSWGWRIIFESGFPFQYLPFLSLCQASDEHFEEFPEGTLRKWFILFAEVLLVFKNFHMQSCCHVSFNIIPLCKEIVFLSL